MALTAEQLNDQLSDFYDTRSHSGRGMYGKECPAFEVESGQELGAVAEIVATIAEDGDTTLLEQIVEAFKGAKTDTMGRDNLIIYFPRITYKPAQEPA